MEVIKHYYSYNEKRYSNPWVCTMKEDGSFDFSNRVGTYDGKNGEEGDLVVFSPIEGAVYGYGQKDYRGNKTEISFSKYVNGCFVECTRLGNIK